VTPGRELRLAIETEGHEAVELVVDGEKIHLAGRTATHDLAGEIDVRLFLDRSVLEVFLDGRFTWSVIMPLAESHDPRWTIRVSGALTGSGIPTAWELTSAMEPFVPEKWKHNRRPREIGHPK